MTEEEKKAIEYIEGFISLFYEYPNPTGILVQGYEVENFETILNLIKSQQEEIEKLKNKNKDLLRKLRNRVKEVKKLTKYSLYKKEFSRLNQELEKKDTIIDLMLDKLVRVRSENKQIEFITNYDIEEKKKQLKQYFEKKVEGK